MSIPRRMACGIARSRKAWSTIVFGFAGSQKTAIRFSVMPRSVSMLKKPAPPSSAYLPASSATPKVVLEAEPARTRAVQTQARTAVIRHIGPFFGRSGRQFEHCIEELSGPEAHRVVGRKTGLLLRLDHGPAGLFLREGRGVQGDTGHFGRPQPQRHPFVQVDELREAHDRRRGR